MKKLTVVIPFYNEFNYAKKTMANILSSSNDVQIILIDDCSNDSKEIKYPNVMTIRNSENKGVSYCRDMGVSVAKSEYILTTDAHMIFEEKGWDRKIIELIDNNKNTIFCFGCKHFDEKYNTNNKTYYPGKFHLFPKTNPESMLSPTLDVNEPKSDFIPCVVGGAYAFHSVWYNYINGMKGMKGWGVGETFLSIKSWLAGGNCKVHKDLKIGHVFKNQNYVVNKSLLYYNKMRLCQTILPFEFRSTPMRCLQDVKAKEDALKMFVNDSKNMLQDIIKYESVFRMKFSDYIGQFGLENGL